MIDSTDTKDKAVNEAGECPHCHLSGQVTIFRREYVGLPVGELLTPGGKPYRARMRAVVFCVCPVGQWMKRCNPNDQVTKSLSDVLEGRLRGWQLTDPTTEDLPESVAEGNWQSAVAWMIARRPAPFVQPVKPVQAQRYPGVPVDSVLTADREPGSDG